jgi:hypothetical protein
MIYARTIKKNEMPGMEICLKDSKKWQMDPARQLLEFGALIIEGYWGRFGQRWPLFSGNPQLINGAFFWQFIMSSPEKYRGPEMLPFGYLQCFDLNYQFWF